MRSLRRRAHVDGRGSGAIEPWALVALGAWLVITVSWWALALWPMPDDAPAWLARARAVCFNTTDTGLPDASGWLLLIGQPFGMLALLYVGWRRAIRTTVEGLASSSTGRLLMAAAAAVCLAGLIAAGARVAEARATTIVRIEPDPDHLEAALPADFAPAPLDLVDQHGERITLDRFRGRPVLLTFAFGHCETVCPVVVRNAETVRRRLADRLDAVLLVVTLDPWRDTPARLSHLAGAWDLGPDGYALSGSVDEVTRVLDGWRVQRSRDLRTGDVVHAPIVYVIGRDGELLSISRGDLESLMELAARL